MRSREAVARKEEEGEEEEERKEIHKEDIAMLNHIGIIIRTLLDQIKAKP